MSASSPQGSPRPARWWLRQVILFGSAITLGLLAAFAVSSCQGSRLNPEDGDAGDEPASVSTGSVDLAPPGKKVTAKVVTAAKESGVTKSKDGGTTTKKAFKDKKGAFDKSWSQDQGGLHHTDLGKDLIVGVDKFAAKDGPPLKKDEPQQPLLVLETDATHVAYSVFFGTDRMRASDSRTDRRPRLSWLFAALGAAWLALALVLAVAALVLYFHASSQVARRAAWGKALVALAALLTSVGLAVWAIVAPLTESLQQQVPLAFTDARAHALQLGVCRVCLPLKRQPNELDVRAGADFEDRATLAKYVVLQRVDYLGSVDFARMLKAAFGSEPQREALVFIHGYNVTFEDAVRRAAQLKRDTAFPGIAACYSWPSNGFMLSYTYDEDSVKGAVAHLQDFLTTLARDGQLTKIHIVAHSMGTRCVTEALAEELALEQCELDRFVLAAPDMNRDDFERLRPRLAKRVKHFTLYASARDRALLASHLIHDYARVGDTRPGIMVADGLESIDASDLDTDYLGHSYYGDSPRLVEDLRLLIVERRGATDPRRRLHAVQLNPLQHFWRFLP